ncbi:MAG: S41 family peptidase [Defluviitaleaceae bacterium]|nr:S41 family peptidase [Defluviitaleaceae bacterium]
MKNTTKSDNPHDELKIYELSLIWKEAAYNFAFWEERQRTLDWDAAYRKALPAVLRTQNLYEYYLELTKFVALLRDGHTNVGMPQAVMDAPEYSSKLPISIMYANGEYVVSNVKRVAGDLIKRWSVIKKIDGQDIRKYVHDKIFPYIWHEKIDSASWDINHYITNGPLGSQVVFELEYDGQTNTITLERTKGDTDWLYNDDFQALEKIEEVYTSDSHKIEMTHDGIAIITIDTMMNDDLPKEIHANFPLFKNARGYVLDIRHNGGGNSNNSDVVASLFIHDPFQNQRSLHPIHIGAYKAWGSFQDFGDKTWEEIAAERGSHDWLERMYKIPRQMHYEELTSNSQFAGTENTLHAPLVVLTTANTGSAAEDLLVIFEHKKRATFVGTASYGSTGQPLNISLESGGSVRICTRHNTHIDGREFINIGVQPHVHFEPSLTDLRSNVDTHMYKGLDVLRSM